MALYPLVLVPMSDRLTYNDDGSLDEVVMSNAGVHLEMLSRDKRGRATYMLILENDEDHVHLTIGNAKPVFVYERFDPRTI